MTEATAENHTQAGETAAGPALSDKIKFAIKTALSLTLAYMIPMALGWAQPQTAAITVMLIAATGALSESLQKGVLRVIGTLAGAAIGLTLIALFPQNRMLYLAALSVVIPIILYLYSAYRGDTTVFMLTLAVTLMVFNGGDAEGAFIYGIDRTLLTITGVVVYSVVGSFVWPVKVEANTEKLAAAVAAAFARTNTQLLAPQQEHSAKENPAADIISSLEALRNQYRRAGSDSATAQAFQVEWDTILACYEHIENILLPALKAPQNDFAPFTQGINNYQAMCDNVSTLFDQLRDGWEDDASRTVPEKISAEINYAVLAQRAHLEVAAVVSRATIFGALQDRLIQALGALNSLKGGKGKFERMTPTSIPAFIWFDRESLKTALRGLFTFWLASYIWIMFNPPGGFMFVTLCTMLVPLVSFTPASPKLLIILFTVSFAFALPAYIFLLPAMSHWLELAAFLFVYAFVGFALLPGPVTIFFLLGLFVLGIQNTMSYHFGVILLVVLMMYMVCALLIISVSFPFTSQAQLLYVDFRRRFFHHCEKILHSNPLAPSIGLRQRLITAIALATKQEMWGAQIDASAFPANAPEDIVSFNQHCDVLLSLLKVLVIHTRRFAANPIIEAALRGNPGNSAARLCNLLAQNLDPVELDEAFVDINTRLGDIDTRLGNFLASADIITSEGLSPTYSEEHLAEFYLYLSLHSSILAGVNQCQQSAASLDWQQLQESRF
ncbi:MAG: FUSC family protein [Halioglobus sp.]